MNLTTIIFSKNRAAQLDLFLQGLNESATVLYTFEQEYKKGYSIVKKKYPNIKFEKQRNFKTQLTSIIQKSHKFILFLVDDDILVSPFSENSPEFKEFKNNLEIIALSLRMSPSYRR